MAPILLRVLSKIVDKNNHHNQLKQGERHQAGVCMAAALLLKERNREMGGIQRLLSLVLFTSRVQKQVWNMQCMCRQQYNNLYTGDIPSCYL